MQSRGGLGTWKRTGSCSATFLLICLIAVQFPRFLQLFRFWSLCFRWFSVKGAAPMDNQNSARQSIGFLCVYVRVWFYGLFSTLPPCYDIDGRYVMWFMCFMSFRQHSSFLAPLLGSCGISRVAGQYTSNYIYILYRHVTFVINIDIESTVVENEIVYCVPHVN